MENKKDINKKLTPEELMARTPSLINDSVNQLIVFKRFIGLGIDEIKEVIKEAEFKTLEEYTGKTTKELNAVQPGVCEKYNSLIKEIQNPDLTFERFKEIMDESWAIAHPNK